MPVRYKITEAEKNNKVLLALIAKLNNGKISVQEAAQQIGITPVKFIDKFALRENSISQALSVEYDCSTCIHSKKFSGKSCDVKCSRKGSSSQDSFLFDSVGWKK